MNKSNVEIPIINQIKKTDANLRRQARKHLDSLAKPPGSLGVLEEIGERLCGICGTLSPVIDKKCLIILAADHGVTAEGVSSAPQSVTASQTINILEGLTGAGVLAAHYGVELMVVDVGVNAVLKHPRLIHKKIRSQTENIAVLPAMSREEALRAIRVGIELAGQAKEKGYQVIGVGEMGIGNTTASSAVLSALLGVEGGELETVTGMGGGLTKEAYRKKLFVIDQALKLHRPDREDPIDVLSKVGGLDLGAMTGVFIGAAYYQLPVVVDGFISVAAALCAYRLNPLTVEYMFASHQSYEKGYGAAISELGLTPCLHLNMRLGEGSGCPIMMGIMDAALAVFQRMATFREAQIDDFYLKEIRESGGGAFSEQAKEVNGQETEHENFDLGRL